MFVGLKRFANADDDEQVVLRDKQLDPIYLARHARCLVS